MHEPNYKSLSIQQLRHLCDERKITWDWSMSAFHLIDELLDGDFEKAISQINPE